jgi:hypothetical protein
LRGLSKTTKSGGEAENEITALNNISKQLEKLNSIDTNIKSLSSNVSSVKKMPINVPKTPVLTRIDLKS